MQNLNNMSTYDFHIHSHPTQVICQAVVLALLAIWKSKFRFKQIYQIKNRLLFGGAAVPPNRLFQIITVTVPVAIRVFLRKKLSKGC